MSCFYSLVFCAGVGIARGEIRNFCDIGGSLTVIDYVMSFFYLFEIMFRSSN